MTQIIDKLFQLTLDRIFPQHKDLLRELFRYGIVGVLTTVVEYVTSLLLYFLLRAVLSDILSQNISNFLTIFIAVIFNYTLGSIYVFKIPFNKRDFFKVFLIGLSCYPLTTLLTYINLNTVNLSYILFRIIVPFITVIWTYTAKKLFVYRNLTKKGNVK